MVRKSHQKYFLEVKKGKLCFLGDCIGHQDHYTAFLPGANKLTQQYSSENTQANEKKVILSFI